MVSTDLCEVSTDLCEVSMMVLPVSRTRDTRFQTRRRETGSRPVVGSSSSSSCGSPSSAAAADTLRRVPPLRYDHREGVKHCVAQTQTKSTCQSVGIPAIFQDQVR